MTTTPAGSPSSAPGVRLGHVALAVQSPDRLETFYRDVVGLQVVRRDVNEFTGRTVLLSGSPGEEDHELVLLSNPQAAHIAFRVPTRAALAAFYGRVLKAAGAVLLLGERLSPALLVAAVLVGAGYYSADPPSLTSG